MTFQIHLYGLLPQDGDPETPKYPVGLRGKEFECESLEEAISLGKAWGEDILPPLGETLTSLEIMDCTPGGYRFYEYDITKGKLKEMK